MNFIRTPAAFNAVYNLVMAVLNDKMKQRVSIFIFFLIINC